MNYTILALQGIEKQLFAVTLMALQNRLAIDAMRAADEGVCSLIGQECCIVIPMHTGEGGNLTIDIKALEDLRKEYVQNSYDPDSEKEEADWLSWVFSGSWKAILISMGTVLVILLFILTLMTFLCDPFDS